MEPGLFTLELTLQETVMVDQIAFDPLRFQGNHHAFSENADLAYRLATSLLERDAIPEQRLRYFTDPQYNPGGRGISRKDGFERYGTQGGAMLRHPHFLKHLRYFIYGADLPITVPQSFIQAVNECGPITSGDIAPLGATARHLVRGHRLEPKAAADEFYKLCLDLGFASYNADSIRSSVQQLRLGR